MSDPNTPTARMSPQQIEYELARLRIEASSQYVGRMIWLITVVAAVLSLLIVLAVAFLSLARMFGTFALDSPEFVENPIPDVLTNWGGVILGFYFGQFVNLVQEFMGIVSTSNMVVGLPANQMPRS